MIPAKNVFVVALVPAESTSVTSDIERRSLTKFSTIFLLTTFIILTSVIAAVLNKLEPKQLNQSPYSLLCFYRSLISTPVGILLMIATCTLNMNNLKSMLDEIGALK